MPGDDHIDPNDPALAEDVDLAVPLRKEILRAYAALAKQDHWQALGLEWNAPVADVRAAYLELVKVFHPDRYAGKRLGSYLGRIERVFRALTEARDVLTDERRRAAYAKQTAPPEEFARIETRKLIDESRAEERRARLARANPLVARAARVQELYLRGKKAFDEGKFQQAANDLQTVLGLDPRHPQARAMVDQAKRAAGAARAGELYDKALAAEAAGNRSRAFELMLESSEAAPGNPKFAIAASRYALSVGDGAQARTLGERAVRAAPGDARAHEALGAALQALGEARAARRELEKAVELDPALESARALLKKLRWSIFG